VVDFTFACIAGVDAMQNCLDFIRLNPKAIVVANRFCYDLNSTGEYTQGAGTPAMLITANPRIIAFENHWANCTKGVLILNRTEPFLKKKSLAMQQMNLGLTI
jgi:hydroxymethylglutaryl-CoA synthase